MPYKSKPGTRKYGDSPLDANTNGGYSPYKMKGHILPGINQKLDANATNVAEQGLAGSSAFQHKAYGSPHPINPQGVEQPVGGGHPPTARAHNVKK